jgi:Got1/Sft2-like family
MVVIVIAMVRSKNFLRISALSLLIMTSSVAWAELVGGVGGCSNGWTFPYSTQQARRKDHFLHECDETLASFFKLLTTRGGAGGFDREYRTSRQYSGESRESQHRNSDDNMSSLQQKDGGEVYDDYYEDDYLHEKRSTMQRNEKAALLTSSLSAMASFPNLLKNGDRKIGIGLLGSGVLITMLGVTLFFNRTLMRIGNLLFIAGISFTIGPSRTIGYFAQPEKIRSTSCLLLGIILVFMGHPTFGIALEIFGLLNLFGNMFPFLILLAKQLPGINTVFNTSIDMPSSKNTKETSERNDKEDYYDYYSGDTSSNDYNQDRYDEYQYSSPDEQRYKNEDRRSQF